jgi:hypothetical protein
LSLAETFAAWSKAGLVSAGSPVGMLDSRLVDGQMAILGEAA